MGITNKTVQHVTLQMLACEKLKVFFPGRIISQNLWPPRSPELTPTNFFLWDLLKGKVYKITHRTMEHLKDAIRQEIQAVNVDFGKSIPEFGETNSSVLGCERRPVAASIMSGSCFASFPVCVYKFSTHYLNNIIFYRQ